MLTGLVAHQILKKSKGFAQLWRSRLRSTGSQPHTSPPRPGFQCQEEKPHNFWREKRVGTE